jgi:hypothetical protein
MPLPDYREYPEFYSYVIRCAGVNEWREQELTRDTLFGTSSRTASVLLFDVPPQRGIRNMILYVHPSDCMSCLSHLVRRRKWPRTFGGLRARWSHLMARSSCPSEVHGGGSLHFWLKRDSPADSEGGWANWIRTFLAPQISCNCESSGTHHRTHGLNETVSGWALIVLPLLQCDNGNSICITNLCTHPRRHWWGSWESPPRMTCRTKCFIYTSNQLIDCVSPLDINIHHDDHICLNHSFMSRHGLLIVKLVNKYQFPSITCLWIENFSQGFEF